MCPFIGFHRNVLHMVVHFNQMTHGSSFSWATKKNCLKFWNILKFSTLYILVKILIYKSQPLKTRISFMQNGYKIWSFLLHMHITSRPNLSSPLPHAFPIFWYTKKSIHTNVWVLCKLRGPSTEWVTLYDACLSCSLFIPLLAAIPFFSNLLLVSSWPDVQSCHFDLLVLSSWTPQFPENVWLHLICC